MTVRRDIVFVAITAVFLCGVLLLQCFALLPGVSLDSKSLLEGRSYEVFPSADSGTLLSGRFQSSFESYVSDVVPGREAVVLADAGVQRSAIRIANLPFGYDAYPSFFGSGRIINDALGVVYRRTSTRSEYPADFFDRVGVFCESITEGNDSIKWAYYVPASSNVSEANPSFKHVSDAMGYTEFCEELSARLPDVDVLLQSFSGIEEYSSQMFRTDHHFQIQGAIQEYQTVCKAFGRVPIDLGEPRVVYSGGFFGSNARAALYNEITDVIFDVEYPSSEIEVVFDGSKKAMSAIDKQFAANSSDFQLASPYANGYTNWFHSTGFIEYENADLPESAGTLLIIADSYISSGDRFYAENWKHVYIIDPRTYEGEIEGIREFIKNHQIDDALFTIAPTTYAQITYF